VSNFEERLLGELRTVVAARPVESRRRRPLWGGPRLALAGALTVVVAAAAIAGVLALTAGTQAAYAVTKNADGTVTVEIDSLSDAAGLQAKLRAAGVNAVVQYLPEGKICQRPWFTPYGHPLGGTNQSGLEYLKNGGVRFTLTANIPADATVVIETQNGPNNETALGIAYAQGDVPACQMVEAPAGSGPLGGPPTQDNAPSSQR
jgi:hypothetical protein